MTGEREVLLHFQIDQQIPWGRCISLYKLFTSTIFSESIPRMPIWSRVVPMLARASLFAGILAGILAITETSVAQTIAETASKWGLLGTWRVNCGNPVTDSDGPLIYVVRAKKLFHDRVFSKNKDSSQVVSAKANPDGSLELVINFTSIKQVRQITLIKDSDGRIQATSSKNNDTDEYTVLNGKFKANGAATPKQTRCP